MQSQPSPGESYPIGRKPSCIRNASIGRACSHRITSSIARASQSKQQITTTFGVIGYQPKRGFIVSDSVRVAEACRRLLGCEDRVVQRFGSQRRTGSDEMRREPRRSANFGQVAVFRASAERLDGSAH